jgi:hypothetical protein
MAGTKTLLFHLFDLTILNSYIILTSCGSQADHQKFYLTIVQNMLEMRARILDLDPAWDQSKPTSQLDDLP